MLGCANAEPAGGDRGVGRGSDPGGPRGLRRPGALRGGDPGVDASPALSPRVAPAPGRRHRRRLHLHRRRHRPLRRDGPRPPGQLRDAAVRRGGVRGGVRGHQPGARARPGLHRAHGDGPVGERHHHRDRDHAGHRADRRHGVDGGEPGALPRRSPGAGRHDHDAAAGGGLQRHGLPGRVPHRHLRLLHPAGPVPRPHEVHGGREGHDPRPDQGPSLRDGGLPHRHLPRLHGQRGAHGASARPPRRPWSGARSPSWWSTTCSPSSPSADHVDDPACAIYGRRSGTRRSCAA